MERALLYHAEHLLESPDWCKCQTSRVHRIGVFEGRGMSGPSSRLCSRGISAFAVTFRECDVRSLSADPSMLLRGGLSQNTATPCPANGPPSILHVRRRLQAPSIMPATGSPAFFLSLTQVLTQSSLPTPTADAPIGSRRFLFSADLAALFWVN